MRDQTEIEKMNSTLKQFWEIEDAPSLNSLNDVPIIGIEVAVKKVEYLLSYENNNNNNKKQTNKKTN